jgi:hypothetical protein
MPTLRRSTSSSKTTALVNLGQNVSIGVKTWGEILDENNAARLQFLKEKLEHRADEGQALAYLQDRHREFLEGVILQDDADDAEETAKVDPATKDVR